MDEENEIASADLAGIFLDGARSDTNWGGLAGRFSSYAFALAYEEDQDKRLEIAVEMCDLIKANNVRA